MNNINNEIHNLKLKISDIQHTIAMGNCDYKYYYKILHELQDKLNLCLDNQRLTDSSDRLLN